MSATVGRESMWADLKWGLRPMLLVAVLLFLHVSIPVLHNWNGLTGEPRDLARALGLVAIPVFGGGVAGGILRGMLRPSVQSGMLAFWVGILASAPMAIGGVQAEHVGAWTATDVVVCAIVSLVGGAFFLLLWYVERVRRSRVPRAMLQ